MNARLCSDVCNTIQYKTFQSAPTISMSALQKELLLLISDMGYKKGLPCLLTEATKCESTAEF